MDLGDEPGGGGGVAPKSGRGEMGAGADLLAIKEADDNVEQQFAPLKSEQ